MCLEAPGKACKRTYPKYLFLKRFFLINKSVFYFKFPSDIPTMYTSSEGKRILYLSESAVTINKFHSSKK